MEGLPEVDQAEMKIALMTNGYGLVQRGAEIFSEGFYKHMVKKKDIFIDLYGYCDTDISIGMYQKNRFQMKLPSRHARAIAESYFFNKRAFGHLCENDYDVVLNNSGFPGDWWLRKYRKKKEVPFVDRFRGAGRETYVSKALGPDAMVFLTEDQKKKVAGESSNKAFVIPNAIDTELYKKKRKCIIDTSNLKRPIILCVGAMASVKQHECVINAVKELNSATLILVGANADKKYGSFIEELGRNSLGKDFIFLGEINHSDIISVFQSSDVFTLASKSESFGIVFLEAMASGLPIVTVDEPRRKSIIKDSGVYCDVNNKKEFSKSINQAYLSDIRSNSLKNAEKYSWDTVIKQYLDCFDSLVS